MKTPAPSSSRAQPASLDEGTTTNRRYITGLTHGGQSDTRGVFNKPHAVALVEAHALSLDVPAALDEGAPMELPASMDEGAPMALPTSLDVGAPMAIPPSLDKGATMAIPASLCSPSITSALCSHDNESRMHTHAYAEGMRVSGSASEGSGDTDSRMHPHAYAEGMRVSGSASAGSGDNDSRMHPHAYAESTRVSGPTGVVSELFDTLTQHYSAERVAHSMPVQRFSGCSLP